MCYSATHSPTSNSSRALPRVADCDVDWTFWFPIPWEALEMTSRAFCISLQTESLLAARDEMSECSKQAEQIEWRRDEFSFREARAAAMSSRWLLDFKSCQENHTYGDYYYYYFNLNTGKQCSNTLFQFVLYPLKKERKKKREKFNKDLLTVYSPAERFAAHL